MFQKIKKEDKTKLKKGKLLRVINRIDLNERNR